MTKSHECQQPAFHDERLTLPLEQSVLLCCMRMWVMELRRGIAAEAEVHDMLDHLGAPSASPHLEAFMAGLSHAATRMIDVQCVCRQRIGADERALLEVLSLAQAMRPFEALLVLRGFVTQQGAQAVLDRAAAIGTALAQAGRFLPEPEEEVRHFALTCAGTADDARSTLH